MASSNKINGLNLPCKYAKAKKTINILNNKAKLYGVVRCRDKKGIKGMSHTE